MVYNYKPVSIKHWYGIKLSTTSTTTITESDSIIPVNWRDIKMELYQQQKSSNPSYETIVQKSSTSSATSYHYVLIDRVARK